MDALDWGHEVDGELIAFWRIDYDDYQHGNPLEEDEAYGHILSLNRRHDNFNFDGVQAAVEDPESDAVRVSYYEHGQCLWMVQGGPYPAGVEFQWDGVSFAGVWLPNDVLKKEASGLTGEERRKKMEQWAGEACEVYTQWCNGSIYSYTVKVYRLKADGGTHRREYRDAELLAEDSCWGHYGMDWTQESLKEGMDGAFGEARDKLQEDAEETFADNGY
jgi:hypothetical protein